MLMFELHVQKIKTRRKKPKRCSRKIITKNHSRNNPCTLHIKTKRVFKKIILNKKQI